LLFSCFYRDFPDDKLRSADDRLVSAFAGWTNAFVFEHIVHIIAVIAKPSARPDGDDELRVLKQGPVFDEHGKKRFEHAGEDAGELANLQNDFGNAPRVVFPRGILNGVQRVVQHANLVHFL